MPDREPRDWYIEACAVCGCQLGPGIGSRTPTGRCIDDAHHSVGGVIVRVLARPAAEQESVTRRYIDRHPGAFPGAAQEESGP